ncbi:hypothetical protein [Staphylococcus kloosii]|uniref:hypothetical protein n=1 Tax=Staphylococcus kloosii TaxID=29384 RepID=UPI001E65A5C3|nr:hypothetical protein [Staphylococcus kloosii]
MNDYKAERDSLIDDVAILKANNERLMRRNQKLESYVRMWEKLTKWKQGKLAECCNNDLLHELSWNEICIRGEISLEEIKIEHRPPETVNVIKVIQVVALRGNGTEENPTRRVVQYYNLEGEFIFECDYQQNQYQ